MTLTISFFEPSIGDINNAYRGMPEKLGSELFGFESWRRTVWGNDELKKIKVTFLNQLKNQDLYIYPKDIELFKTELELVLSKTTELAVKLGVYEEDIQFRIKNAINACMHANNKGYGLCIS